MSDVSQGPGWWLASDGKWYPPQSEPAPPPPTPVPPPAPQPQPVGQPAVTPAPAFQHVPSPVAPPKKGMSGGAIAGLIVGFLLLSLLGGCVALVLVARQGGEKIGDAVDRFEDDIGAAIEEGQEAVEDGDNPFDGPDDEAGTPAPSGQTTVAPSDDVAEVDPSGSSDVGACRVDGDSVSVEISNSSAKQSTFWITLALVGSSGEPVEDQTIVAQFLPSGALANYGQAIFTDDDVVSCEVTDVERFAAPSQGLEHDGECVVTGVDSFDDLTADVVLTSGAEETLNTSVSVVFLRDGVQFGSTSVSIAGVAPGETAPGRLISSIDGPADGVECRVVSVDGFSNSGSGLSSFESCTVTDRDTVVLKMTNDLGTKLNFSPVVVYYDDAGTRVSDEIYYLNHVRADEDTQVEFSKFGNEGTQCSVVDSDTNEPFDELPTDGAECEVTGVDSFDDLEVLFTIENRTGEAGDFEVVGALIENGVRIGDSAAFIDAIAAGASQSAEGFSTTEGSPSTVTCEVVYLSK